MYLPVGSKRTTVITDLIQSYEMCTSRGPKDNLPLSAPLTLIFTLLLDFAKLNTAPMLFSLVDQICVSRTEEHQHYLTEKV